MVRIRIRIRVRIRLRENLVRIRIRVPVYRLKRCFRENLGSPFIIAFQILLLACAGLLIQENSALANEVAIYAYYSLVIGVVLQLVCFIKHGEKATE